MGRPINTQVSGEQLAAAHARFMACYPRMETAVRHYNRDRVKGEAREEAEQEAIALCWKYWLRLVERGKRPELFPSAIGRHAARAVRHGRRLVGSIPAKDVFNPMTQGREGFGVRSIPLWSTLTTTPLSEALTDNTRSDPADAAAFRCDFPLWFSSLSRRNRDIVSELMSGERGTDVANRFGLSEGRISQLRTEFRLSWELCQA